MMGKNAIGKKDTGKRSRLQGGNAIVMLFAAISMAGIVTYGLNNVMRGPAATSAEISRRSIAENNLIATTRLAISAATHQQNLGGDCDGDGFVEPLQFRDSSGAGPVGGGWVPSTVGASMTDPWGAQYGYCVWDPGTATLADNVADCGGNTARRLTGAPRDDQYAIAVISAGRNGAFETDCNAYLDANDDNVPDNPLVDKDPGSDDIVLAYTYAEANGIGGGEWKLKDGTPGTAEIGKDIEIGNASHPGGASFTGALELSGARGLILPRDPGDDSVTGACAAAKDGQLRLNVGDGSAVPSLEICFETAWTVVSGGAASGGSCTADFDTWEATTAPVDNWEQISMSTDGEVILVQRGADPLLYSHDGGEIWAESVTGDYITDIDVSGDGDVAYAATANAILKSTDGGVNWSPTASGAHDWMFVDTSSDGSVVAAVTYQARLWVSTDGGANWTEAMTVPTGDYWWDIAVSKDGSHITGLQPYGLTLYVSTDGGSTFASKGGAEDWGAVAMSANGTVQAATTVGGSIYLSTDGGNTWAPTSSGNKDWWEIAVSDDGSTIVASVSGGAVWYSQDEGVTWTESGSPNNYNWHGITISGDGTKVAVAEHSGTIHISNPICDGSGGGGGGGGGTPPVVDTSAQKNPHPLDTGMIGRWKMDEGTGTVVADSEGDNDGAFVNTPSWTSEAPQGQSSLFFDSTTAGVGDGVVINSDFGQPTKGTIALWANIQGIDGTNGADLFNLANVLVLRHDVARLTFYYKYSGSWRYIPTSTVSFRNLIGTGWHHIVATFDDDADMFRLYVDGIAIGEATYADAIAYDTGITVTRLGKHAQWDGYDLHGGLDDVRLYNRALGPGEVAALYERVQGQSPVRPKLLGSSPVAAKTGMVSTSGLSEHSCAIKPDGSAWCWGNNTNGRLGINSTVTSADVPKRVQQQSIHNFHQISVGRYSTCGVTSDGTGWCWGEDGSGQLGNGSIVGSQIVPSPVDGGAVWMQISAGGQHACGIRQSGVAYCWGVDTSQQLGNGAGTTTQTSPVTVNGGGYYSLIKAGLDHTCGIKTDGSAWCWGLGTSGQLGNGGGSTQDAPVAVSGNFKWKDVSLEAARTCGVTAEGGLWCWGAGYGNKPLQLEAGESWSDVEVGTNHLCASKTDGSLWCQGSDTRGQLGNDSAASATQAMPMRTLLSAPVTSFAAGNDTSCAMLADNTLWCWGADNNGSLGNGSTTADQFVPARIASFPAPAPWVWNAATSSFKLNGSVTIALGNDKWISPSGDASYFGFESAGKARLRQTGSSNQLLIETGAASNSAQASFKRGTASPAPIDATVFSVVVQWPFDQSAGTNVPSAPSTSAGTASGTYTWNTTGDRQASGGALEFDGDTGRVSVANSATFRPSSGSYTIAVWVRPDGYQAQGATILSKSYNNGANHSYALTVTADQKVAFVTTSTGPSVNTLTSNVPLRPNAWTKIEASMTFTGANIVKTLRINGGNEVTSGTVPGPMYSTDATGNLFFGAGGCVSPCNGFRGGVDDFRIHNAAWSADVSAQSFMAQTSFITPKAIGIDYATNNLEAVTQNATATDWVSAVSPGLSLTSSGNLGAGVASPSMKVEAAGGVRVGYESTACSPAIEGAMRYTGNTGDEPLGYSCTATNWASTAALIAYTWNGITYANGRFMAVATTTNQTNIYTSQNGLAWTSTGSTGVTAAWEGVAYGNGVWVVVGSTAGAMNHVMTSTDNGVTWTPRSAPDKSWTSVTFANGVFVATAIGGVADSIMTSPDGITWTPRTTAAGLNIPRAAYGNGVWMAVSWGGEVLRSTDNGATWVLDAVSGAGGSWNSITYGNGLFVMVATNGYVMSSADGLTWASRTPASMSYWISVNYLNNVFLATSNSATTMISPDGVTWTGGSMATGGTWVASAYGAGRIVALRASSANIGTSECLATSQGGSALLASALGYWKFDESSGSTASDSTGTNPGTLAGNAAFVAGKKGNALSLDGTGDYANMGSAASLDNLSALSVCSWVKAPTTQTQPAPAIVGKLNSGGTEGWMVLAQSASGTADLDVSAMLSGEMKVQEDAIPDETWKHLCVTWDGTATEAGTNLYVDGAQMSPLYYSGYAPEDDSDGNFAVGYLGAGSDFKGLIDEVVLFNRELTPAEVAEIMQATSGDPVTPEFQVCDGAEWTDFAVTIGGGGGPGYLATRRDWGVDAGRSHTCAVRVDGALSCWGSAASGRLGNGSTSPDQTAPVKIGTSSWTHIAAGTGHTCGIQADGSLWCWGMGWGGQIGNGDTGDESEPVKIGTSSWVKVTAGDFHTCGIQADGSLWCWGGASNGRLGNGSTSPNQTAPVKIGTSSWTHIAAVGGHTCGIQADGSLWCWGYAASGRLGNGSTSPNQPAPVKIGTSSWVQIAAGTSHTCGIQADGSLWCWGYAGDGALGNGSTSPDQTAPVQIGTNAWAQITAGYSQTCGVQTNGSLWCWGEGTNGQLGNGDTANETEPVQVLPNSFTFNDVGGADHNTLTTSNTITISGIYASMPVSVSGAGSPEISINGGAWATSGTITNGQTLAVRLTSANTDNTARAATVTVGGLSDNWSVTTKTLDTTPNAFSFTDVTGANFSTLTTSNTIAISGIDSPAAVSVSGTGSPEISINGGGWTTSGTITNGQSLAVRLTSAPGGSTARSATVTVGGVSDNWSVTTKPAVVPGSQTFNASGTFVVPAYNNMTVQVWGAGGGGRGLTTGGNGGYSYFNGLYGYGGTGGTNTTNGSGGTATGGTTNLTGGNGTFSPGGGNGANGGSGGAAGFAYSAGMGGSAPGGGGGGGGYVDWNTSNGSTLGSGGGGGYATTTYSAGALTVGASMGVTVGGGGGGGPWGTDGAGEAQAGGGGAGGRVTFTWN